MQRIFTAVFFFSHLKKYVIKRRKRETEKNNNIYISKPDYTASFTLTSANG
jgi:hypothetical protein